MEGIGEWKNSSDGNGNQSELTADGTCCFVAHCFGAGNLLRRDLVDPKFSGGGGSGCVKTFLGDDISHDDSLRQRKKQDKM